jgi:microcystin-dependent protein
MGSGCDKNKASTRCVDVTPDNCVIYTGPDIPSLGICNGDKLSEIEAIILSTLQDLMSKHNDLYDITLDCDYTQYLMMNKEKDLISLLQALFNSQCELKSLIDALSAVVYKPLSFDTKCLALPSDDLHGIIQALIDNSCKNSTDITNLQNQFAGGSLTTTINVAAGNTVLNAISVCDKNSYGITKSGSGESAQVKIYGLVPPMCPIPCIAPLSNFDSTGKGLPDGPYCGMFIMNGMNGTPDWRGYGFASVVNIPGINSTVPLNPMVDPAQKYGGMNLPIGIKYGTNQETLTVNNMPVHSHGMQEIAASLKAFVTYYQGRSGSGSEWSARFDNPGADNQNRQFTVTGSITATVAPAGGGSPHNNVQPTTYGYWIVRLS